MQLDSQPVSFALLAIKVQDFPLWWLTGTVMCSVPSCEASGAAGLGSDRLGQGLFASFSRRAEKK